jgi:hypothetical protein
MNVENVLSIASSSYQKTDVDMSFPVLVLLGRFFLCIYKGMSCIWYISIIIVIKLIFF